MQPLPDRCGGGTVENNRRESWMLVHQNADQLVRRGQEPFDAPRPPCLQPVQAALPSEGMETRDQGSDVCSHQQHSFITRVS